MLHSMDIYSIGNLADYELIDSGDGYKLERFGDVRIARPDPQVLWKKRLSPDEWNNVSAVFEHVSGRGKWNIKKELPESWKVSLGGITFQLEQAGFKHVGVFPEQAVHWKWLKEKIEQRVGEGKKVSVLNLFGYTGGASLACGLAGASVCHVDASEGAVDMAYANRDASGLTDKPIRFIVDDVRKFVEREIKRGNKYDVIVMDPPVYGKGIKNEIWKIEDDLEPFLSRTMKLLSDNPLAVLLNGYASGYSHVTYKQLLLGVAPHSGTVVSGEIALKESGGEGRLLPCGIFARWEI